LKLQNTTVKSTNYYQLGKIKKFFKKIQTGVLLTSFSDTSFQSLVSIPQVKLEKCPSQKFWIGRVSLAEELFYYKYPFFLPDFFKQKITKDELEVQVKFIQVFSSVSIEKEFFVQEFLNSYSSVISNKRITNIKTNFIQLVKHFQKFDLIESNISQGFIIYEKIDI
jgi:hypothetical protein